MSKKPKVFKGLEAFEEFKKNPRRNLWNKTMHNVMKESSYSSGEKAFGSQPFEFDPSDEPN
jgi:hypothetical protein